MENVMGVWTQGAERYSDLKHHTLHHQYLNSLLTRGLRRLLEWVYWARGMSPLPLHLCHSLAQRCAQHPFHVYNSIRELVKDNQTALSVFGPHIQSLGMGILILLPCCRLIERERNNIRSRFACVRQQNGQTRRVVQLPLYGHKQIHYEAMMIES